MYLLLVGISVAVRWALLYAPMVFITQLWAGSEYSPGQGGGWRELAMWAGVFGVVAVAACVERAANGSRIVDPGAVLKAALAGHAVGTGIAVAWFGAKGAPSVGDWFVAPAMAAAFVIVWVHFLAARLPDE